MNGYTSDPQEFWNGASEFFSGSGFAWKFALILCGVVLVLLLITIVMKWLK